MMIPRVAPRSALSLVLALAVAACGGEADPEGAEPAPAPATAPEAAPEAPPLVVGYSALRISLPVVVADARGLFERHGVRVELRRYETAQPLVEEVIDGRVDAGGYAALPIVLTVAARAGRGVRVATGMVEDAEHPISMLLRAPGSGITSVAELRGKRVGILPTVAYQAWIARVLRAAEVDPAEVTIVPLAPPQQVPALSGGGVDALFTNDPMATAAIASGAGERFGPGAPVPDAIGSAHVFGTFLVAPDVARDRPREVAALLAALDEAIAEIHSDPAAANDTMAAIVREPERPHVRLYPPARYLTSAELDDARFASEVRRIAELELAPAIPPVDGWSLAGSAR